MTLLPDIQETSPEYRIAINIVGVETIKLPFSLLLRNGETSQLVANVFIATNLRDNIKGISMSRLLLSIKPYLNKGLNWSLIKLCLDEISSAVGERDSYIKFYFDLPVSKKSPISDNEFPLFYPCSFEASRVDGKYEFIQSVEIQYSSYCPCSAELAKHLMTKLKNMGFPHAQRSFTKIRISMDLINKKQIWLEDIIEGMNKILVTQPYPIIKRIDEQELARVASENPLFVEDAIRLISYQLEKMDGIVDWIVKCKHEESIHTHEAIAINCKGVENGFNYNSLI